ncbi:MAG: hypothetical protein QXU30_07310 [Sulfolobales archaeon]
MSESIEQLKVKVRKEYEELKQLLEELKKMYKKVFGEEQVAGS